METARSSRMNVLVERLRTIDKSISRMTAERLKVLAEIAKLDAEDGASERQTASRVARLTSSTPKQAAGDLAMAKQVSALPAVADAHAKGEISNGQLGAVAAIASASSESEALALAKSGTSSQLQQRAAASRGKLFEERCKAQTGRYLAFKPEEGGQSTRIMVGYRSLNRSTSKCNCERSLTDWAYAIRNVRHPVLAWPMRS